MRSRVGTICMVLGAALILAALSLFVINKMEERRAAASVGDLIPQMDAYMQQSGAASDDGEDSDDASNSAGDGTSGSGMLPDPYNPEMTVVDIDGYGYIGYVSIPALNLKLPVMSEWDYTRLKIAPCRYYGSTKTDDLVIAAHNYTCHFGRLSMLSEGDSVIFTDMDGVVSTYQVSVIDVLPSDGAEEMVSGDYDLTLFTCTYGNRSRITVRCERTSAS